MEKKSSHIEEHIGKILVALLVTFIAGTVTMVYSSDKNNALLTQRITYLEETIAKLDERFSETTDDRWKRRDQLEYSSRVDSRMDKLEERLHQLEIYYQSRKSQKP